ncbi:MAG TPA: 3-isopropylmalate dehydratase small subunit [bacterium]|nr:3-isopropylmalate dehydratase small subunit [bacterium]
MKPFTNHTGVAVPFDRADVDTDLIIPARFLKRIERTGYGDVLFQSLRYLPDGSPNPEFVLNRPQYREGSVLVAGRNFGCGSSREHAAWALQDYGFSVVIAPSFADIFSNNAAQIGLLTVVLPEARIREILETASAREGYQLTVDLEGQTVVDGFGRRDRFEIDAFKRHCLLNGLDPIGLTLQHEAEFVRFEARRPDWMPRVSVEG